MSATISPFVVRASHLLQVEPYCASQPDSELNPQLIEDGAVALHQGKVLAVGKIRDVTSFSDRKPIDLGDGLLMPGLVNAHTHLEFSQIAHPLGHSGIGFTDWIRLIVKNRSAANLAGSKSDAIRSGLMEARQTGTCWLGEIATAPMRLQDYLIDLGDLPDLPKLSGQLAGYQSGKPQVTVCLEQLGRDANALTASEALIRDLRQQHETLPALRLNESEVAIGLSPHAPYSVSHELLNLLLSQLDPHSSQDGGGGRARCELVAMHLAETREELELLKSGSGPFAELLADFGVWDERQFTKPQSVLDYLTQLARAKQAIVVHGNYLNEQELDFVASHSESMAIVFCPRTHAFFQHAPYPLENMLERGIRVAVGTDSRASNPDLNLYAELKKIASSFPALDWRQLLAMGTSIGASALGGTGTTRGTLTAGSPACLSFVRRPLGFASNRVRDWIFSELAACEPLLASH